MRLRRQAIFDLFDRRVSEARKFALGINESVLLDVGLVEDHVGNYPKKRNFAQTDGVTVYVAPKFFNQDLSRIDALIRHELAHAVFMLLGMDDHSEIETDALAEMIWNQNIYYDSDDVQTLKKGTRPRPHYLPQ